MHIDDIVIEYYKNFKSIQEIANMYNTYPSKISKMLKEGGYQLRSKSESQRIALEIGKTKHPTKGTVRSDEVKKAISKKNHEVWNNLTEEEREYRSQIGKETWAAMSDFDKEEFMRKAQEAIRDSAKNGSLMERHLLSVLSEKYNVIPHKKGLISNEKFEVDLYVTNLNLIIEVDGPAHFEDLWGEGKIDKQIQADNEKSALFMSAGFKILRLKDLRQNKSQMYFAKSGEMVLEMVDNIANGKITDNFLELELG